MNENSIRYSVPPADRLDEAVRANPTNALLIAVGIGLAIAVLIKAARPPSPRHRLESLLEDLEDRLQSVAQPAARRASSLAESGAGFLEEARGNVESTCSRAFRDGRRHWKRLFA